MSGGSSAPKRVRLRPDGKKVPDMDADFKKKLIEFRTSMALVNNMYLLGIITEQDYVKASEIIAKRVGISLSNICCRMPLRSSADRANM